MNFRGMLLFGAIASGLAAAPRPAQIGSAATLGAWFGVACLRYMLRERRMRRLRDEARAEPRANGEPVIDDPWIDCDARKVSADGGLISECHERKGHTGPHRATVTAEWS